MRAILRLLIPPISLALGALVIMLPGGCGSASAPLPTTVRGLVRFQGQPLAGGMVVFAPDQERGTSGQPASAEVASDGTFRLGPSISPGWYRVAIAGPHPAAGAYPASVHLPARLARPDRSELLREVQAGKENTFEFLIDVPSGQMRLE